MQIPLEQLSRMKRSISRMVTALAAVVPLAFAALATPSASGMPEIWVRQPSEVAERRRGGSWSWHHAPQECSQFHFTYRTFRLQKWSRGT